MNKTIIKFLRDSNSYKDKESYYKAGETGYIDGYVMIPDQNHSLETATLEPRCFAVVVLDIRKTIVLVPLAMKNSHFEVLS